MRFRYLTASILAAPFILAGCGSSDGLGEPELTEVSSTTSTSSTSSTTTTSSTVISTTTVESEPTEKAMPAKPSFVECYEDGAALLSDGSIVADSVNCDLGSPQGKYQCPGTDSYVPDASYCAPEQNSYDADQECIGPAAECGYGYDEYGNRNPSSGELQAQWGCQQGYITDPELCAAVADL